MPDDNESQKTLWLLECDYGFCHQLKAFYAVSEKDAQSQAQRWLEERLDMVIPISLHAYPRGFTIVHIKLPGRV